MFLQAKAQKQAGVKHCLKLVYIYNKERKKLKVHEVRGFLGFSSPFGRRAWTLEVKGSSALGSSA